MSDVLRALGLAFLSLLHPRMLWLALWPFLLSLCVWGGLAWVFRQEALAALGDLIGTLSLVGWIDGALAGIGIGGFKVFLVPLAYIGLLIPTIVVTAILIIALVAMPAVVAHVGTRQYADVARRADGGGWQGTALSLFNGLWVTAVFAVGWVATMPLWLIAPLALLLPLCWWAWLTARVLRLDSLLAHATAAERNQLITRHGRRYLLLGLCVSLMNFIPPLFVFAPVYSGLAFTHFSLHALRRLRGGSAAPGRSGSTTMRDMGAVEIVPAGAASADASVVLPGVDGRGSGGPGGSDGPDSPDGPGGSHPGEPGQPNNPPRSLT